MFLVRKQINVLAFSKKKKCVFFSKKKNKGEFVILVDGNSENHIADSEILRINRILAEKVSSKDAIKMTAKITKKKKNDVYKLVMQNDKK